MRMSRTMRNNLNQKSEPTIGVESLEQFELWLASKGLSSNTANSYLVTMRQVLASMNENDNTDLKSGVTQWLASARENYLPSSFRTKYAAVLSYQKYVGSEITTEGYKLPPVTDPSPRPLKGGTSDVMRMIVASSSDSTKTVIALGGLCGLRVSESVSILVSNTDLQNDLLTVVGKGGKMRVVPISSLAKPFLVVSLFEATMVDREHLVDCTLSGVKQAITASAKRAELGDVTSHQLRATFATEFWKVSKDIKLLAKILGHSSTETSKYYVLQTIEDLTEVVSGMHSQQGEWA